MVFIVSIVLVVSLLQSPTLFLSGCVTMSRAPQPQPQSSQPTENAALSFTAFFSPVIVTNTLIEKAQYIALLIMLFHVPRFPLQ